MENGLQVSCVVRGHSSAPHQQIEAVGGETRDGVHWYISHELAIEGAEARRWNFYLLDAAGRRIDLVVATAPSGEKYLKASTDHDEPDALLHLRTVEPELHAV